MISIVLRRSERARNDLYNLELIILTISVINSGLQRSFRARSDRRRTIEIVEIQVLMYSFCSNLSLEFYKLNLFHMYLSLNLAYCILLQYQEKSLQQLILDRCTSNLLTNYEKINYIKIHLERILLFVQNTNRIERDGYM